MTKREVRTSPRALQHIAFAATVLFGLVVTYAIHITNETVSEVKAYHYDPTVESLEEARQQQLGEE